MASLVAASGDFAVCHEALSRICRPYRLESSQWRQYQGSIRVFRAASLDITELVLPGSRIVHDESIDADDIRPYFSLVMQMSGASSIAHHGRQVDLRAGECTLVDSREPTQVELSRGTRQLSFNFFADSAIELLTENSSLLCQRIACTNGAGSLLSDSLRSIVANADALPPLDLREWALDLLLAALGRPRFSASAARGMDIRALIAYVDSHLHVTTLSPQSLASHFNLSLRQLYRVAAAADQTPAALIWERRLWRARQLLAGGSGLSVTQVAYQCGFKDGGHFSRAYRRAFGESPSESRDQLAHTA